MIDLTEASKPQPAPKEGRIEIVPLVMADMEERAAVGELKYGTRLKSHNGRDPLWDAYQEAIDFGGIP